LLLQNIAMAVQVITLELRRWLTEQKQSGQTDDAIVAAMVASGWQHATAVGAVAEVEVPAAVPPGAMPEPALAQGANAVQASDRDVAVLAEMTRPRVVVFGGLLDAQECDDLVELAAERLARSETVTPASGGSEINPARTSDGMFFARGENALITRIEARIAALLNWPVERGEGLQILRYRPGAEYKPHYDYFDPREAGTPSILRRGGQRLGSLVMYLNTPTRGGATTFPDVGFEVKAVRGNAAFFSYAQPKPDTLSLHGGAPVQEGEKWVATKWLREGRFD
jgi:prolyl 4-hydroxylase